MIPFTSIVEQNADAVRALLEREDDEFPWVLEHHGNLDPESTSWHSKLVTENWDAPIVFTTMVQFLNTLFDGGTRGVRRMHQIANSVIIFDEIQTIPIICVHLFCNALNFFTQYTQTTAVLCTATQPLLDKLHVPENGQLEMAVNPELAPNKNQLYEDLRRVQIENKIRPGGWSIEEVTELAVNHYRSKGNCLVIVNTKEWARRLYSACAERADLSTGLSSEH